MSGKIKLTYFDLKGRAELTRLIFAAAEVPFEDNRLSGEEWAKFKPSTPFGQLPVLDYCGCEIGQSMAIARFAARKCGLAGRNELEQGQADMIVDHCMDALTKIVGICVNKDAAAKEEASKDFFSNYMPGFLKSAEELLKKRGGKHFAGCQLTWGDIAMFHTLDCVVSDLKDLPGFEKTADFRKEFSHIADLKMRVAKVPGIAKHIESRPKTSF